MSPNLNDGDIVFFKKYKKDKFSPKIGQIIIFKNPINNQKQIKRIKNIKKTYVEVVGDNLELSKDSRSFGFVQKEKIIGIVTSKLLKFNCNIF